MIINAGKDGAWSSNEIVLRWREQNELGHWERKERVDTTFKPYLFVNPKEFTVKETKQKIDKSVLEGHILDNYWNSVIDKHCKEVSPNGDELWKVTFDSPGMVGKLSKENYGTYEGDVPYEDRYLVDNDITYPDYEPRMVLIDLEALQYTSQSSGPEVMRKKNAIWADRQEINVIGCYDSYTKTYVLWTQHSELTTDNSLEVYDGIDVEVNRFTNEFDMLNDFVEWLDDIDPDVLLAWGMGFYDLPTLYARLESTGVGAYKLSPSSLGKNRFMEPPDPKQKHRYHPSRQPIVGRVVISLDTLFDRVYHDSKSTNITSNKLDVVGRTMFGRGKTDFRPDFYDPNYHTFINDFLYYNFRDVELMVEIEEKYNLIKGQMALQGLSNCKLSSTLSGSSYARPYFMRKAGFRQKTGVWGKKKKDDDKFTGAIILDPIELGTIGLHKNVAILDFAGLYPSIMVAYNTSWETKVGNKNKKDDDIKGDGCWFRKEPIGILPSSVLELDALRDSYKKLRNEAAEKHGKTSDEFQKWNDAQKTVKRLRATFYGLMGLPGYAWGDMDIAKTITKGGRDALLAIIKPTEEMGYEVIYGHTDSIFVKMGDDLSHKECVEKAQELAKELTLLIQKEVNSDALVVEAEILMDRFLLAGAKNKYAGRAVWLPEAGYISDLDVEDRMKIQGLEIIQTNTANIAKEIQLTVLKMIWDDTNNTDIVNFVLDHINNVREGNVKDSDLIGGARIRQWLPTKTELRKMGKTVSVPLLDEDGEEIYEIVIVDGKKKKQRVMTEEDGTAVHYGEGATNQKVSATSKGENKCFASLSGTARGAAWHNIVLSNNEYPPIDKEDAFRTTFVKDGPTWIPTGGYISFHDPEQIAEYELDLEKIIHKFIIKKLKRIMYSLGINIDELTDNEDRFRVSDFFE